MYLPMPNSIRTVFVHHLRAYHRTVTNVLVERSHVPIHTGNKTEISMVSQGSIPFTLQNVFSFMYSGVLTARAERGDRSYKESSLDFCIATTVSAVNSPVLWKSQTMHRLENIKNAIILSSACHHVPCRVIHGIHVLTEPNTSSNVSNFEYTDGIIYDFTKYCHWCK